MSRRAVCAASTCSMRLERVVLRVDSFTRSTSSSRCISISSAGLRTVPPYRRRSISRMRVCSDAASSSASRAVAPSVPMLLVCGRFGVAQAIELGVAAQRRLDGGDLGRNCAMRSSICCRLSSTDARLMRRPRGTRAPDAASARRAAPVSIDAAATATPSSSVVTRSAATQHRGGVEQHDIAARTALTVEHIDDDRRVGRRVAAANGIERRELEADIRGSRTNSRTPSAVTS